MSTLQDRITALNESGQSTIELLAKLGITPDQGNTTDEQVRPARDVPLA